MKSQKNKLTLLIVIILFLFYCECTGQTYNKGFVSIGIDPKMLINGAYDYNDDKGFDITVKISSPGNWTNNEIGVAFEYFGLIDYYKYGFFYYFKIPVYNELEVLIGPEVNFIIRQWGDATVQYIGGNINLSGVWYFSDRIGFIIGGDWQYRTDLKAYYNTKQPIKFNGSIGLKYRW